MSWANLYPLERSFSKQMLYIAGVCTLVCGGILWLEPFGLSYLSGIEKYFKILGYGMVTIGTLGVHLLLFQRFFNPKQWTIGKQVLWHSYIVSILLIGVYAFSLYSFNLNIQSTKGFALFLFAFVGVFVLLLSVFTFVRAKYISNRNINVAKQLSSKFQYNELDLPTVKNTVIIQNKRGVNQSVNLEEVDWLRISKNQVEISILNRKETITHEALKTFMIFEKSKFFAPIGSEELINKLRLNHAKGNASGVQLIVKNLQGEYFCPNRYLKKFSNSIL